MTDLAGQGVGQTLRQAGKLLTWRVLLWEWAGTLLLVLLAFAWLQIADSHVWQFAFSIVSGGLLVVAFIWVQTHVFRMLLARAQAGAPFWLRFLTCLVLVGLWFLMMYWIGIALRHAPLYAGYWNSKLSPGLRYLFPFERLVSLQQWLWELAQWVVLALLAPIALEGGSARLDSAAWKRIGYVYRHWLYWLVAVVFGFSGSALSGVVVNWKPGSGVALEILSTLLRVGAAYTVVILLWTYALSLAAVYLVRKTSHPSPH
jgi:hypothetical protein